ncbi:hydantoinase/oxoprolinase N-terminal domain-containing protein [Candidatus Spongiihabitans sp.]|uniref:hydantoinase/oxoprolinase N-terminal domain-containing protein n=1 Tax=Candidatus Spongiihabitans sp. TaxID=3101308 RepID=UPI003C7A4150
MSYQLGIDTGGTYTDAVIVDERQTAVAKNKSLTTSFDLTIGIGNAISSLPQALLEEVNLVALSTTLSTNSVVEGRGAPVAILLPGYNDSQVAKSGLLEILEKEYITLLDGGHDATGAQLMSLDSDLARKKILEQNDRVSAFAVSAMFGTRNSSHEKQLRDMVKALTGKPVVCGHELASSLGAPRRALTVALNARMILYIQALINSVESILQEKNITAPLMIVKGDGSLVNAATALLQPVTTVLSGPAASVIGACALSGLQEAIVVDIGGTTTDIAIVTEGKPQLCEDGARIGNWQPMVEAIRVFSIGLGGDSEVRFKAKLDISQRRVVPMSLLAHQFPQVMTAIERQYSGSPSPRNNKFALPLQNNEVLLRHLNEAELAAWERLLQGPVELESLVDTNRPMMRAIARMERLGLVIYSGFTPSDATHVLGMSDHWNIQAAELGAKIWARQMRHLYGCGNWEAGDAIAPCQAVFDLVTQEISQKLIEAGLNQHGKLADSQSQNLTRLLVDIVLKRGQAGRVKPLFNLQFAADYPIVAVGGPAADFFPEVARLLAVDLHIPTHADTANAIGAVLGAVVQIVHITVNQPEFGVFILFHKDEPIKFEKLDIAIEHAIEMAKKEAYDLAEKAGAMSIETTIKQHANHIKHDIDGELFVSTTITAVASGRPNCLV